MSVSVRITSEFRQDVTRQIRWYQRLAGPQIALRYSDAVDATLELLGRFPQLGPVCRFEHPELRELRQYRVEGSFDRHQVFYRITATELIAVRTLHGMRDLERRLVEPPGTE
jgi:toxin ParE1/3/4